MKKKTNDRMDPIPKKTQHKQESLTGLTIYVQSYTDMNIHEGITNIRIVDTSVSLILLEISRSKRAFKMSILAANTQDKPSANTLKSNHVG